MKRFLPLVLIAILLGLFYSLGRQIINSMQTGGRIDREVEELGKLQKRNTELKKKLAEAQSLEFIEQQARNKLNMSRLGETVVIIPQGELEKVWGEPKKEEPKLPNWQGWLKLFFK